MEKNKKDLMILIAIIFIGINYAIYNYFITVQIKNVKQASNNYNMKKQKLNNIKAKKQSLSSERKAVEELKKNTAKFDTMVPFKIDTPNLIYDFYNSCKKYGIIGENVSFQIVDNNNVNSKAPSNNNITNKELTLNFYALTIDLKVIGDKENIENFLENLGNITDRKLNVKSIDINSGDYAIINNDNNTSVNKIQSGNNVLAQITFYQYIQGDINNQPRQQFNYEFYNVEEEGFNNISDMFK